MGTRLFGSARVLFSDFLDFLLDTALVACHKKAASLPEVENA
jgi:hypothetical protein